LVTYKNYTTNSTDWKIRYKKLDKELKEVKEEKKVFQEFGDNISDYPSVEKDIKKLSKM